eukprot:NODE_539_length_6273_cov_0.700194.p3 type:complete len:298 gc:universal NODE_539_length_6273_cov_0.700194:2423-1530(-)
MLVQRIELALYAASLYGLRWINNDTVMRMSMFYLGFYILSEAIILLKTNFVPDLTFNGIIKLLSIISSVLLSIFIIFDMAFYIPILYAGSAIFLLIETMTIINLSFDLTMKLVEYHIMYIVFMSLLAYSVIISYCIYILVMDYSPFLVLHLFLILFVSLVSIHPKIQSNVPCSGLLSSCIISLQATFLIMGNVGGGPVNETILVIGLIVNLLSLIRSVVNHAISWNHPIIYHFIILMSLMYFGGIMTNWNHIGGWFEIGKSDVGFWMKLASSWLTFVVYLWCLVAPSIFPDRDFGYS